MQTLDCWLVFSSLQAPPLETNFSWTSWRGKCGTCHQLFLAGAGFFCRNFSSRRGPWTPCHQAWCGQRYTAPDDKEFPIAYPEDEDGVVIKEDLKSTWYLTAQNGDNLFAPFQ